MNHADHNVQVIFGEALDCASPAEQASYLDRACAGEPALRARIEALLHSHKRAGQFLQGPSAPAERAPPVAPGTVLDHYQLLEPIGEGGFGIVYRAEQLQPVRRQVALKIVKPGMDSRQVIARFEAERQALALMNHPNIARVLDAGEAPPAYAGGAARPYFVMELVEGAPFTDFCDLKRLWYRERLELFTCLCHAVQHAHQKGIIHRDLKPSNVLVTQLEGLPVVKVIDFGIAKALGQQLTDKTLVTGVAQLIGTPLYMSPEQAEPGAVDIDTRSDIYSLGVLLYELLTGTTPFDRERLREVTFDELRRIIREEEPPRPSTRVNTLGPAAVTLAEQRQTDPRQLGQLLRGELDWVVMKCLEKDRSRRYQTADALAQDVVRYLADEPVEACPPSPTYRLGKFLRKHRRPLVTAAAFLILLLTAGVLIGEQAMREARADRDRALEQVKRNVAIRNDLDQARALRDEARATRDSGKWARARAQAQRALALVEAGPTDEALAAQVRQLQEDLDDEQKDRQLLADLEAAHLVSAETLTGTNRFASERAIPQFRDAFRAYGVRVGEGDPAVAAARFLRRPPEVRQAVSIVLDKWLALATTPRYQIQEPHLGWLREFAAAGLDESGLRGLRAARQEPDPALRRAALERLAAEIDVRQVPSFELERLTMLLQSAEATRSAVQLLRQTWQQYPAEFWVNETLGLLVWRTEPQHLEEAVRHLTAGVALRPDSPGALLNLGGAMQLAGQRDEAIACLRRALEVAPEYAHAHYNLGLALYRQGRLDDAVARYRRAIELDPNLEPAHRNLGVALLDQGRLDEAVACFRRAVELEPKLGQAHYDLGLALQARGRVDEAITSYCRAIEFDPELAPAHINLGVLLKTRGRVSEAIACFRRAIDVDPKHPRAHYGLGLALYGQGRLDEAIACYRRAVACDPAFAEAHCNLGGALGDKGDFRAALASFQTGHGLGSQRKDWPHDSANWVKQYERLVQLDDLLAATRKGEARPAGPAECVALAEFCLWEKRCPAAAVHFFTEAFTAQPKLASDPPTSNRSHAALAAALAGCGQGKDTAGLSAGERARLRRQGLEWLRADLAFWLKHRETGSQQARQTALVRMQEWLSEPKLAGVRDAPGLTKLPAEERRQWQAFWADVTAARK
jgi:serine/threonine protein kinase/Flp pilus assembly protein TadD